MGLQLDASPEELKLFLEEAEEHLQLLEEDLVRLENEGDNQELLQEIFRSAHTLKGSSATLGHQKMAHLTHAMENVFDKFRKQQLTVNIEIMNVLFEALDNLKILKNEIETMEESGIDLEGILQRLSAMASGEGVQAAASKKEVPQQQPVLQLDWQDQKMAAELAQQKRGQFWQVNVFFAENSDMLPVRALITLMTLREKGDIIKSEPTAEEIEQEQAKTTLRAIVLSSCGAEEISKALQELPDIINVKVEPFELAKQEEQAPQEQKAAKKIEGNKNRATLSKASRTVRIDVELLDNLMNLVGELVIDRTRLAQIITEIEAKYDVNDLTEDLNRTSVHIGRVTTMLQEEIMKARMIPVESLFNKFPRMMRDLSQKAGKEFDFIMEGQETELDRSIIEEIGDPLIHLLRNAVDHAIEPPEEREKLGKPRKGVVKLIARHEENHIVILVQDDGRGIDPNKIKESAVRKGIISDEAAKRLNDEEAINLIFASGLSTATKVSDISGRGVGMDVVRTNLEKVNGSIEIDTRVGVGTVFKIKLPLTLAIIRALMVKVDERVYAIPLTSVLETIRVEKEQIRIVNKHEAIVVRGQVLPLLYLRELYNHGSAEEEKAKIFVVVVNVGGKQVGLVVDYLIGEQEVVIKSLGRYIGDVQGIAGATILGDGRVALIMDVPSLMKKVMQIS
ncbi:two-component system, chemotaxis family, sensor kinase CheA [Carboxydocella sporoproducens DSM 16521]|uniref:Chemotaxis protein CheA n=2 Tax=Carboxydocella TaxID=178898 RepID=A0A1T4QKF4_9FIRM|nr:MULTISPECIES: chemotaxis protein CheA [Carboxydocella]SKA03961.1 two-component system, chemotaxis family, sensor kinase CheA [Carboxydocella sporoproducens DSM 16521]